MTIPYGSIMSNMRQRQAQIAQNKAAEEAAEKERTMQYIQIGMMVAGAAAGGAGLLAGAGIGVAGGSLGGGLMGASLGSAAGGIAGGLATGSKDTMAYAQNGLSLASGLHQANIRNEPKIKVDVAKGTVVGQFQGAATEEQLKSMVDMQKNLQSMGGGVGDGDMDVGKKLSLVPGDKSDSSQNLIGKAYDVVTPGRASFNKEVGATLGRSPEEVKSTSDLFKKEFGSQPTEEQLKKLDEAVRDFIAGGGEMKTDGSVLLSLMRKLFKTGEE